MINSTKVFRFCIAVLIHRESSTVYHCLKKRLRTRKEGGFICDDSVTKKSRLIFQIKHITKLLFFYWLFFIRFAFTTYSYTVAKLITMHHSFLHCFFC